MGTHVGAVNRRAGERRNFIQSLRDPSAKDSCRRADGFQTFLALAVHDYNVPVATLAKELGVKEVMVQSWLNEDRPVIPPEPTIGMAFEIIIRVMEEDLKDE